MNMGFLFIQLSLTPTILISECILDILTARMEHMEHVNIGITYSTGTLKHP